MTHGMPALSGRETQHMQKKAFSFTAPSQVDDKNARPIVWKKYYITLQIHARKKNAHPISIFSTSS
jgi:hypothetical protein